MPLRGEFRRHAFSAQTGEGLWLAEPLEAIAVALPPENQIDLIFRHAVITDCNLTMARMSGHGQVEMVHGTPFRDLFSQENPANVEFFRSFVGRGYVLPSSELHGTDHEGEVRRFVTTCFGEISDGYLTRFWGIQVDAGTLGITNTKKPPAEQSLQAILAVSPVGIGCIRGETLVWANKEFCNLLDCRLEEIRGTNCGVLYESLEEYNRVRRVLYAMGHAETKLVRKDGTARHVDIREAPTDGDVSIFTVTDITRQNEAEGALRFTQFSIDNAFDGIVFMDETGRFAYVNDAFCRLVGYDREELQLKTITAIHRKITHDIWREEWKRSKERGIMFFDASLQRKDGADVSVETVATYVEYNGVERLCAVVRDVTVRKRAEEKLKKSEYRFRSLIEKSAEFIILVNREGIVSYVSPPVELILGYAPKELTGYPWTDIVEKEDVGTGEMMIAELLPEARVSRTCTVRMFHRDGALRWMEIVGRDLLADPSISSIILNIRDVTDKKKVEDALFDSEVKYRSVVENSLSGFFIIQDSLFRFVNKRFCEIHGYSHSEVVDRMGPLDCVDPGDRERVGREMQKRLSRGGEEVGTEFRAIRKDGSVIHVRIAGSMGSYKGRTAMIGTLMDVTREKTLESQLQRAQRMEAIGSLAGGVAHDFNNILTALIGYGKLLQARMDENDPLRAYVEGILNSSEKGAGLTRNLLAFSRNKIKELKPIRVASMIKGVQRLLGRLITEDIELKILGYNSDLMIMGDISQMDQILLNLTANAKDAMPNGGRLVIGIKEVTLSSRFVKNYGYIEPGSYILLSIADTGLGMDEKTRGQIFEPFFTTKEAGKGTGLGLSIVYNIVKQHKGYIDVYSELGRGTVFRVYLPAAVPSVEIPDKPVRETPRGTETLLLAEDDEQVRSLTREILATAGYKVIEAVNGEEAVGKFTAHGDEVALLILDVVMPKKNGKEAYDEIRTIDSGAKALFVSGYTGDIVLNKGVAEGEYHFMQKPVLPDDLLRRIRTILDG